MSILILLYIKWVECLGEMYDIGPIGNIRNKLTGDITGNDETKLTGDITGNPASNDVIKSNISPFTNEELFPSDREQVMNYAPYVEREKGLENRSIESDQILLLSEINSINDIEEIELFINNMIKNHIIKENKLLNNNAYQKDSILLYKWVFGKNISECNRMNEVINDRIFITDDLSDG
eukprot:GHVP01057462.1.p1 GENE.GHVP01057462.1~~GHVP01057462.1.p1  ORF type:complete len:179 (+),score=20.91 GHVP01057462.1:1261-1797(+)